jgi:phenylalanyl-tRNA synthetase beta chain
MKFSQAWLQDYVAIDEPPARVGERLTAAGIPLDGCEGSGAAVLYDFDVFSNRPDCMNHLGLAREYAALTGAQLRRPEIGLPAGGRPTSEAAQVAIEAPDLCSRYSARCVLGVRIGPSPDWLVRRLESIGQRSINNVVDVTNFVLWELGHPLHAFDLARLDDRRILVRRARAGERLLTLDGIERTLTPDRLVIADARRPVALAGVMGGQATEIGPGTRDVLLESAWFEPVSVRRTARALGLHTDASHRFERGADPEGTLTALDRTARLIAEVAGGVVTHPALDLHPRPQPRRILGFRPARATALLGLPIPRQVMRQALARREFEVSAAGTGAGSGRDAWEIKVPSFRRDVEREADLIEEVARHHGYDAIPSALPLLPDAGEGRGEAELRLARAHRALQTAGLSEAINLAMIDGEDCRIFDPSLERPVAIDNPLQAQAGFLRSSLLPALLRNVDHNLNHAQPACHLYEIGTVFHPGTPLPEEGRQAAFALAGRGLPVHWSLPRREVDLYDARGVVEHLARCLGLSLLSFSSDTIAFLAPGRALRAEVGGRSIGVAGELAEAVRGRYGIDRPVFVGVVDLEACLRDPAPARQYRPLSRQPAVRRDVSLVVGPGVTFEAIERVIRSVDLVPIVEIEVFDQYRGPGVPEGSIALAIQIVFQSPERTLAAEEVQAAQDRIVAALGRDLGVMLRGAVQG